MKSMQSGTLRLHDNPSVLQGSSNRSNLPCKRSESCFFSKILRAYLHNSLHARMFYADTPTRGFAVVAAPPRYEICGFKAGATEVSGWPSLV
jgi:hypothetical protein